MPQNEDRQRVRVTCDVAGYEHAWVELDVTDWGYAEYLEIFGSPFPVVTMRYFEPYCTAWHVKADDGAVVAHPGRAAPRTRWSEIYRQLGVQTSRKLGNWFALSCMLAAGQALELDKKSDAPPGSGGAKPQDAGGRDEGTPAA